MISTVFNNQSNICYDHNGCIIKAHYSVCTSCQFLQGCLLFFEPLCNFLETNFQCFSPILPFMYFFNLTWCDRFGVLPLEFDGLEDSLFHPFDAAGRRHMEYIRQRGSFDDVPFDEIVSVFKKSYPEAMKRGFKLPDADFEADAENT